MKDFNTLTQRGKVQRYRKVLIQALKVYPIDVTSVRFVSLESKPVFRVTTDSGDFAAKFHAPEEHTLSQVLGEMQFLAHISKHSDLFIETPLANSKGEFVTQIISDGLPEAAHIVLCSWVPGRHLSDFISARSYHHLGACAAMLHDAASSFKPDGVFDILTNNQVFYWDKETILTQQNNDHLPQHRQDLFRKGADLAQRAIELCWQSRVPIIIHNDLHPCNVKVHHGNLAMYDFEDMTWGFPEQDIGTAVYHIRFRDDYRKLLGAFRAGYEQKRPWPLNTDGQLDSFVIARLLMFANYVVNYKINPAKHLPQFEVELSTLLDGGK